ncbi:MAG TPA: enolase C-terminal domain-like protein [Acidimicrobiales bacterium]|nr:enolase C-terminal domain-like protein [Acidimicrobiales bacterium]
MSEIEKLDVSVYTVPTEAPESDGTLTWTATTVVVAEPRASGSTGLGFSYATGACARLINDVPVYGSGGFTSLTDDELAHQLGAWVHDLGIPRVKMKVGEAWGSRPERDLARAALARRTIGEGPELFVDANGGYATKQAIRLARAYADLGVTWFEEPVSSDHLGALAEIRAQTPIDIAAGEYGYDLFYFQAMCDAGAVDCLQADVSRCAGVTEWLRVAALAESFGLQVSGHCAQSLHLHPACAVDNVRHLEYFADHARLDRMLFDGVLEPAGGVLRPDLSRPGLGLELKRSDAEVYRVPG